MSQTSASPPELHKSQLGTFKNTNLTGPRVEPKWQVAFKISSGDCNVMFKLKNTV